VSALGQDRLLLGFPVGGTLDGHIVRYALISQQPTTLGELNGQSGERVRGLAGALKAAGFPTTISGDMDGWLKDLLAERGLDVSYETVRRWLLKFGSLFARELRRRRPRPTSRWHLDEMAVMIAGG
jgi:hypothetical protein